jgi:hypothetical protein
MTYKLEILGNVGVIWSIGTLFFPQLGKRNLCPSDLQCRLEAFDEFVDESRLYCIWSGKIIRGIKNLDRQLNGKISKFGKLR